MYERNAIVLERYFEKCFGFGEVNNLRENYLNYRKLVESFERYSLAITAENKAIEEFNNASNEITKIQKTQEKLYNKGAKFEYSRYIIFNNIKENPDTIDKCLSQVQIDVEKNNTSLKELGEKFVAAVITYNEKKDIMENCQEERADAKQCFEKILSETTNCYKNISEEKISYAKDFITSENKENKKELANIFTENGKNERNQFDTDVIVNTINVSISIYKIEMDIYITGYDRTAKLLTEIDTDTVKLDKHKKFYNDSKVKLEFINAEKDYLVQFLDNERITAIYDKKTHRKLMLEACRNLNNDLEQINKLYDIIQKEIAGRYTKKLYKENYNREYLINLERTANDVNLEQPKVRANAIAVMNLNYWRIDGIRRIYEAFDNNVSVVYERDLSEYNPLPEPPKYNIDELENELEIKIEEVKEGLAKKQDVETFSENTNAYVKKGKYGVLKSSKKVLANAIYISLQTHEFSAKTKVLKGNVQVKDNQSKIEKFEEGSYFDLDAKMASLDLFDEEFENEGKSIKNEKLDSKTNKNKSTSNIAKESKKLASCETKNKEQESNYDILNQNSKNNLNIKEQYINSNISNNERQDIDTNILNAREQDNDSDLLNSEKQDINSDTLKDKVQNIKSNRIDELNEDNDFDVINNYEPKVNILNEKASGKEDSYINKEGSNISKSKVKESDNISKNTGFKIEDTIKENYEDLDVEDDEDYDIEESILDLYFSEQNYDQKRKEKDNKKLDEINKTGSIFKKIIKMNSKKKRKA